jgi:flagellar protein FlaJ
VGVGSRGAGERWYSVSYFAGFGVTLAVTVVEALVLLQNIELIRVSTPLEVLQSPLKAVVLITFITSLFAVPAFVLWASDVSKSVARLYRRFVVMSLEGVDEKSLRLRVSIILIAIPIAFLSILFSIAYRIAYLALAPLIPLLLFTAIALKPMLSVSAHGKAIEAELKWFLLLLIALEHVRAGIQYAIERLGKVKLLPAIAKELRVIHRDTMVYFTSYVEALIHRAKLTPSQVFKRILLGYSMRVRSGGDTVSWLKAVLNEELVKEEWMLKNYSERVASIVLQVSTALFILLPTLTTAIPIINPSTALLATALGAPALSLVAYAIRPKKLDKIGMRHTVTPLLVLVALSLPLYLLLGPQGAVFSWLAATLLSFNAYEVLCEVRELDLAALELLKNVAELRKYGLEIPRALKFVTQSGALTPRAQKRIAKLLELLEAGHSFGECIDILKTPSHTFNFTILYLGMLHECGGGDEEVIQMTYEYLYRFKAHEDLIKRTSHIFDFFAVANLFILVWVWRSVKLMTSQWQLLQYALTPMLTGSVVGLIMAVSMISYSLVSSIVRNGLPVLEVPREVPKALLTLAAMSML